MAVLLACPALVGAQQREREREPARCVGKLKAVSPGAVQVETDKGERWLVALDGRSPEISFQGSATPAFVQAGMLVQFRAGLDKKGEAQDAITELKVISPRMGIQVGLQPDGGFSGGELFASDDDAGKKKKKPRGDSAPYQVTGTVRSIKDGKMYVAAGATVKAELADNCQITFDTSDIRLAREGDNVETEGWRYPNQSNQMYARRLTITAEKVIGAEEKKRRPTPSKDDKKVDEKPKDAAEGDKADKKDKPKDEAP